MSTVEANQSMYPLLTLEVDGMNNMDRDLMEHSLARFENIHHCNRQMRNRTIDQELPISVERMGGDVLRPFCLD
jgi:hypothetical protein